MGVEISASCDECGTNLEGESTYCDSCVDALKEEIDDLTEANEELKEQLKKCQEGCSGCSNKVECIVNETKKA